MKKLINILRNPRFWIKTFATVLWVISLDKLQDISRMSPSIHPLTMWVVLFVDLVVMFTWKSLSNRRWLYILWGVVNVLVLLILGPIGVTAVVFWLLVKAICLITVMKVEE